MKSKRIFLYISLVILLPGKVGKEIEKFAKAEVFNQLKADPAARKLFPFEIFYFNHLCGVFNAFLMANKNISFLWISFSFEQRNTKLVISKRIDMSWFFEICKQETFLLINWCIKIKDLTISGLGDVKNV